MGGSELVLHSQIGLSSKHADNEEFLGEAFVGELAAVLSHVPLEPDYAPDRARQTAVLRRLPSDIVMELAGHLRCAYLEEQKFARLRGVQFRHEDFDDEMVLRGKVFELLVGADPVLHTPDAIAEEILALMHDPDRFGLSQALGHYRTPDAAYLAVDQVDDVLVVRAIAEAKLGKLNTRAHRQLSQRGFRFGLERVIDCVNALDDLQRYGLIEIVSFGRSSQRFSDHPRLMVAPDVHQFLVVPADRDISDPASLIRASDFDEHSYSDLFSLLTDEDGMTIKSAAFSTAEVAALSGLFYDRLSEGEGRERFREVHGLPRRIVRSESGHWWADWAPAAPSGERYQMVLQGPDGSKWTVIVEPSLLGKLAPYPLDLRIMRLGDLLLHEDFDDRNLDRVQLTSRWGDRPLFAGFLDGKIVLLDGATRAGSIARRLGAKAADQLVLVQVVDPTLLTLDTWLDPSERLTIEEVWQYVAQGRKVLPRQTRFGVAVGGVNYSVAETQPKVTFAQPILVNAHETNPRVVSYDTLQYTP